MSVRGCKDMAVEFNVTTPNSYAVHWYSSGQIRFAQARSLASTKAACVFFLTSRMLRPIRLISPCRYIHKAYDVYQKWSAKERWPQQEVVYRTSWGITEQDSLHKQLRKTDKFQYDHNYPCLVYANSTRGTGTRSETFFG